MLVQLKVTGGFMSSFQTSPHKYRNTHTCTSVAPACLARATPFPLSPAVSLGGVEFPPARKNLPGTKDVIGYLGK